jgi:D-glycero-alpha-D-manno-heptose 1-phosphate guanylyltransferase
MPEIPDVIILSGGFGLRLRGVIGETPKPMAPIAGRPFLELLLRQLKRHGFSRIILSVGYKQEMIREHFGEEAFGLELLYSIETSPLGTGGALREAADYATTEAVLVMNGDSYTDADISHLVRDHEGNDADVTVVVVPETRSDAGSVVLDRNGNVKTFAEKRVVPESRYLSAGIYMLDKRLVGTIPTAAKISLEEQLFPQWLTDGKSIGAFIVDGPCVDIGTPERYRKAQAVLEKVESGSVIESEGRS